MEHDDGSDFASIEEEFSALGPAVALDPQAYVGVWRRLGSRLAERAPLYVDFGSGMGDFVVALAKLHPDALAVGIEKEPFCVAKSARKALAAGLVNCTFALAEPKLLDELFAPGEVDAVFLNYPTPHPRARDAEKRMVHAVQLAAYGRILAPGGFVRLKTDSQPLYDFTLTQLEVAGFEASTCPIELPTAPTGYEQRLSALGAPALILAMSQRDASLDSQSVRTAATAPMSLYDYLPENLEGLAYVPKDMQRSVRNIIEARARVAENRARRSPQS